MKNVSMGSKKKQYRSIRLAAEAARNRSDEWKANHSAAMKKRVFTPEHRRRFVEANTRTKTRKLLTKIDGRI
jgi:hypothetical protein